MNITVEEFKPEDHAIAQDIAERLGFTQTAYTSSSLPGLYCLPDHCDHRHGVIIKTREYGMMFCADVEDMLMYDLMREN